MVSLDFSNATRLKEKLNEYTPLDEANLARFKRDERIYHVYASCKIEGNTIDERGTMFILEKDFTISGKSLKEHLEIVNLDLAMDFMESLVNDKVELTESIFKELHYFVCRTIRGYDEKPFGGIYREVDVFIRGSTHTPPSFLQVPKEMKEIFMWYEENKVALHPIELTGRFHHQLTRIHPFSDGNGRTSRLVMNFILSSHGYPIVMIEPSTEKIRKYFEALEKADSGDITDFTLIINDLVTEKLKKMVETLEMRENLHERRRMAR